MTVDPILAAVDLTAETGVAVADGGRDAAPLGDIDAAAMLFLLVDDADAAALVRRLSPAEVRRLGEAVLSLEHATEAEVHGALDRFAQINARRAPILDAAPVRFTGAVERALGTRRARGLMAGFQHVAEPAPALPDLAWLDAGQVLGLVADEHPQLIALLLAHLDPRIAGAVLKDLPEAVQEDVLHRIGALGPISADALAAVAALVARADAAPPEEVPAAYRKGVEDAAAILKAVGRGPDRRLLRALAKRDRTLARAVEDRMLTFADLAGLDDRQLSTLLRGVESDRLVPALKGADAAFRARCLAGMSTRAAQTIEDALAELGPMPLAEVEEAQRAIVATARLMADDGTLTLPGGGGDCV